MATNQQKLNDMISELHKINDGLEGQQTLLEFQKNNMAAGFNELSNEVERLKVNLKGLEHRLTKDDHEEPNQSIGIGINPKSTHWTNDD